MCRVRTYCFCSPLSDGCGAIGILCILFCICFLTFAALKLDLEYNGKLNEMYHITAILDLVFTSLFILSSLVILRAAMLARVQLLAPWTSMAIAYIVLRVFAAGLDIYVFVHTDHYYPWQIAGCVLGLLFVVYLIYCHVVVCSYKREIVDGHETELTFKKQHEPSECHEKMIIAVTPGEREKTLLESKHVKKLTRKIKGKKRGRSKLKKKRGGGRKR